MKRSRLAKELSPYLQRTLAASSASNVNINEIVAQVRDVIGQNFVTDVEFLLHIADRDAHHEEIHDIIAEHTGTGAPYSVVGLDEGAALEMLPTHNNGRTAFNTILRSNNIGGLGLRQLDTDEITSVNAAINLLTQFKSSNYASQTSGFRIVPNSGEGDFRYLYADELHVRVFYADLVRALSGVEIVAKSVAELARDFVAPQPAQQTAVFLRDHKAMPGVPLFENGDYVGLQFFSRDGGGLVVAFCWGIVSAYASVPGGEQRWTFTRLSGSNLEAGTMAAGTIIGSGGVALDYGKPGNGYVELNAIDGPSAANAPYMQIVQWYGHPATGKVTRTRSGNLRGLGFEGEFGLYAQGENSGQYLKATGLGVEGRNTTDRAYNGVLQTYQRDPNGTLRVGSTITNPAHTALAVLAVAQTYNGQAYGAGDLIVGNPSAANLFWDLSAGRLYFRQGATARAYVDTDGTIRAASGQIVLRDNELLLFAQTPTSAPKIVFRNTAGIELGSIHPQVVNGTYTLVVSGRTQINSAATVTGDFTALSTATFNNFGSWTNAAFVAGWANVVASGADNYELCQYRKVGDVVTIRGLVKRTSGTATTIFTLPTGLRPLRRCWRVAQLYDTGYKVGRVDVLPSGAVSLVYDAGATAINFLELDISFSVL